jgi:hypothetical protein
MCLLETFGHKREKCKREGDIQERERRRILHFIRESGRISE